MKPSRVTDVGGSAPPLSAQLHPYHWYDAFDVPRFMMNASRAWIVEVFYPEEPRLEQLRIQRSQPPPTRSRFKEWQEQRKYPDGVRPAHWRIIRENRDPWEDIRRKDRMILEEGMTAIRAIYVQNRNRILRLRNIKTGDEIMGAIVCADIPAPFMGEMAQTAGMQSSPIGGWGSHSKN